MSIGKGALNNVQWVTEQGNILSATSLSKDSLVTGMQESTGFKRIGVVETSPFKERGNGITMVEMPIK